MAGLIPDAPASAGGTGMPDDAGVLREINRSLGAALLRFRPDREACTKIRPGELAGVARKIRQAREILRRPRLSPAASASADRTASKALEAHPLQEEISKYRANLEALRRRLPELQVRLLAERSRLEAARTHAAAAANWTAAQKQTR